MFSFSYFLHHTFLSFFAFLYDKPDITNYSLELVSSLYMTKETTPIYIFLSHSQFRFHLMNTDYFRNSTICFSVH